MRPVDNKLAKKEEQHQWRALKLEIIKKKEAKRLICESTTTQNEINDSSSDNESSSNDHDEPDFSMHRTPSSKA